MSQVNKWWSETSATSHWRYGPYSATATWRRWSEPYLEIIEGRDAGPDVLDTTTVFTGRPSSFVEFDVTQVRALLETPRTRGGAAGNWRAGACSWKERVSGKGQCLENRWKGGCSSNKEGESVRRSTVF